MPFYELDYCQDYVFCREAAKVLGPPCCFSEVVEEVLDSPDELSAGSASASSLESSSSAGNLGKGGQDSRSVSSWGVVKPVASRTGVLAVRPGPTDVISTPAEIPARRIDTRNGARRAQARHRTGMCHHLSKCLGRCVSNIRTVGGCMGSRGSGCAGCGPGSGCGSALA